MNPLTFDFSGKTVIVTGAGRGIGKECALAFAANGANVVVSSRSQTQIDAVCADIIAMGREGLAIAADVTDRADVQSIIDRTIERFGAIDVLVNNAGAYVMRPLVHDPNLKTGFSQLVPGFDEPFTEDDWHAMFDTNVKSIFYFCQAVGPHMMARKYGKIVNIGSTDGQHGIRYAAAYAASKAAVHSLTRSLALEWTRYNINVNCVGPGFIQTDLAPFVYADKERAEQTAKATVPMRRFGQPEEIATPVLYLASDHASYVTGQDIFVDGGVLA